MIGKQYVLSTEEINIILKRLSFQVAENITDENTELVVVGIKNRGYTLATKIVEFLGNIIPNPITLLSLNMNKDFPDVVSINETIDFNNKNILIIDDVVNNGRTLMYAIKPFLNFYPKQIQTLVLVERMYKLFPVKADYIGLSIATTMEDHIVVEETDNRITGAYLQ